MKDNLCSVQMVNIVENEWSLFGNFISNLILKCNSSRSRAIIGNIFISGKAIVHNGCLIFCLNSVCNTKQSEANEVI